MSVILYVERMLKKENLKNFYIHLAIVYLYWPKLRKNLIEFFKLLLNFRVHFLNIFYDALLISVSITNLQLPKCDAND